MAQTRSDSPILPMFITAQLDAHGGSNTTEVGTVTFPEPSRLKGINLSVPLTTAPVFFSHWYRLDSDAAKCFSFSFI